MALYRKYRPFSFSQVSGQNHIKTTLQNEIVLNKISHAYLLCGPRGVGKTTIARIFAKAVNCLNKTMDGEPCNECASCEEINSGKSLDIIEVDAASHTGVDNVRENIISNARFTPNRAKFKVFIIDEVHMLSISAFNALLKILEEPPSHVIFILATTEIHKLPLTIISRCQRFDFKKINLDDLVLRLKGICKSENVDVDTDVFKMIAKHAEGCLRDAESLLDQILSLGSEKITLEQAALVVPPSNMELVREMTEHLINKDAAKGVKLINTMLEQGVDLNQFGSDLIEFLRKALIFKIDNNLDEFSTVLESAKQNEFLELLNKVSKMNLIEMLNVFLKRKQELKNSSILQLPLEMGVIEVCSRSIAEIEKLHNPQPQVSQPIVEPIKKVDQNIEPEKKEEPIIAKPQKPAEEFSVIKEKEEPIAEPPVEQTSTPQNVSNEIISFAELQEKWPDVLGIVRSKSYSMFMNLKVGDLLGLENNTLEISFPYDLQKGNIEKKENYNILAEALKSACGVNFTINLTVDPNVNKEKEEKIKEVLDVFGGQIVE